MYPLYTAVVKQENGWWIGWIAEVPNVNCQETTHAELLQSLRVTLQEALQLNRSEIPNTLAIKICKDLGVTPIK